MKTVAILGSTGSIGQNALRVISRLQDSYRVIALAAGGNAAVLSEQINVFRPQLAAIVDQGQLSVLEEAVQAQTKLLAGEEGVMEVAGCAADIVVMAIGGSRALLPTFKCLEKSKRLALASKECLVMAGDMILQKAKKYDAQIIPIDSEHSAIFQCINNGSKEEIEKIYLTGSGGPLQKVAEEELEFIPPDFALAHPHWKMGEKISIDSATLMNKGLEVIEAHYLFNLPCEKIEVLIHPEAIVHSLVQFVDGSILAQLAQADMRIPIQYALTYPHRLSADLKQLDFSEVRSLNFQPPDLKRFPCLQLALDSARQEGLSPTALCAADEECVQAYLAGKIKITDIARIVKEVLSKLKNRGNPTLDEILQADRWAREEVRKVLERD